MSSPEAQSAIDRLISDVEAHMETSEPGSEEYEALLSQYERLNKLRLDNNPKPKPVDRNTLVTVGGYLLGTVFIMFYEHAHVIVSKAWNDRVKPKVE